VWDEEAEGSFVVLLDFVQLFALHGGEFYGQVEELGVDFVLDAASDMMILPA